MTRAYRELKKFEYKFVMPTNFYHVQIVLTWSMLKSKDIKLFLNNCSLQTFRGIKFILILIKYRNILLEFFLN